MCRRNAHHEAGRQTGQRMAAASLTISFGLVSIPVKLHSATSTQSAIRFNYLHEGCGSRVKQQYICEREGVVVARDKMVKGYEFAKGQYVTFSNEELKALEEAGTGAAEITEFIPVDAIDPVFYEKAYYLSPDKGGAKPYALLRAALLKSGRSALGRYAAHGKQYIVLIRPLPRGMAMQQLYYADEVRSTIDLNVPDVEIKEGELSLAMQLVDHLASDQFQPENYRDTVTERIQHAVQGKIEGQQVVLAEAPSPARTGGEVIDLMAALRASLGERSKADAPAATGRKPAKVATLTPVKKVKAARK
jgi:DNA end-binding protein Ku